MRAAVFRVGAVAEERVGQLGLLGGREPGVHLAFGGDLGEHQSFWLVTDTYSPVPIEKDPATRAATPVSLRAPGDTPPPPSPAISGVGHQPVHRTEHGRPQPAAGYVAMPVGPPAASAA